MTDQLQLVEPTVLRKSLVEKLAEACDAVGGVEKKGRNQAQGYDYIKAADVAKAIRHELFSRGIVVFADEVEMAEKQITFTNAKGETRHSNQVNVKTAYRITDGEKEIVMHGYGIAWDSGDKAIYKAKTGALKYFLRSLGLIPDEKDDPEYDQAEKAPRIAPKPQRDPILAISQAARKGGKTEDQVNQYMMAAFDIGSLVQLRKVGLEEPEVIDQIIRWCLNSEQDLQTTLKASVKAVGLTPKVLYTAATKRAVPDEDVKIFIKEHFGAESSKTLNQAQLKETLDWIETVGA